MQHKVDTNEFNYNADNDVSPAEGILLHHGIQYAKQYGANV